MQGREVASYLNMHSTANNTTLLLIFPVYSQPRLARAKYSCTWCCNSVILHKPLFMLRNYSSALLHKVTVTAWQCDLPVQG